MTVVREVKCSVGNRHTIWCPATAAPRVVNHNSRHGLDFIHGKSIGHLKKDLQ